MQSRDEIKAELKKMTDSQRQQMVRTVGAGNITALNVRKVGHKTVVGVTMFGLSQTVELGSRGKVLSRVVH